MTVDPKDRIICALDVDSAERALELVRQLRCEVGLFKVGLELLTSAGIQVVERLRSAGAERIFLDAKLHDIPNTVAGAMRGVVATGVWCVTVHASGGRAMLRAAVDTARSEADARGAARPRILAVTVLTSIDGAALAGELHVERSMEEYVAGLALMAREEGCDGVIASPREIQTIRAAVPASEFLVVTPGVRPAGSDSGDQARVMTPAAAVRLGASYLVIGRPIVGAPDPAAAARQIAAEIAAA